MTLEQLVELANAQAKEGIVYHLNGAALIETTWVGGTGTQKVIMEHATEAKLKSLLKVEDPKPPTPIVYTKKEK